MIADNSMHLLRHTPRRLRANHLFPAKTAAAFCFAGPNEQINAAATRSNSPGGPIYGPCEAQQQWEYYGTRATGQGQVSLCPSFLPIGSNVTS